ncbi:MAG: 50S ribosomal protein L22 [Candidatus Binatia bacterium]
MESKCIARYVRISPRKARLVINQVSGRGVEDALTVLDMSPKKAGRIIARVLRSAIANAEDTQNVDVDKLYVKRAFVDGGPITWRVRPRAQGRATPIAKRTSHITVVVDELPPN